MDPNACLQRILEAVADNDSEELLYAMEDLHEWLRKGGAMPTITVIDAGSVSPELSRTIHKLYGVGKA